MYGCIRGSAGNICIKGDSGAMKVYIACDMSAVKIDGQIFSRRS